MKLGIVVPCYNEHEVLSDSAARLTALLSDLTGQQKIASDSFILFVNDGSRDNTWEIISELYETNPHVYGLNLAGNVGHQNAIMAGMMTARTMCDVVITIDADLQDDLNAIGEMIDRYKEGNDIVYGVKVSRVVDPLMKRTMAIGFYKLQHAMGIKAIPNHADFRLLSAPALEQLSLYGERNLYLRGIIPLMGFQSATVDDVISDRLAGHSKYTLKKMLALAVDGITSFSTRPIYLIMGAGFLFLFISLLMCIYVLVSYVEHRTVPGWASLMLSVWFIGSVILLSIGIVGQYIGKIYIEVKNRPLYHVKNRLCDKEGKR